MQINCFFLSREITPFLPHLTLPPSLPPSLLQKAEGWQICSKVHFATWRPTASLSQPIRGCEKQTPAQPLVYCCQELIPLSMAVSLCRLAVLKPIILPPFFVQTSFLQHTPFTYKTHTHTHLPRLPSMLQQETEAVWESEGPETNSNETSL